MTGALTSGLMSPAIRKGVDRARREPEGRFHSLAHLLDVPALAAAYWSIRKDAAVGGDGVTKDQYGQDFEQNLQDLYARLRSQRYRHQPIRRVHIPKDGGRTRPIGISALEDKIGMCCNFQKEAGERWVGSSRRRLMQPPRTAC